MPNSSSSRSNNGRPRVAMSRFSDPFSSSEDDTDSDNSDNSFYLCPSCIARRVYPTLSDSEDDSEEIRTVELEDTSKEATVTKAQSETPTDEESTTDSNENSEKCPICLIPIGKQELASPEFCNHLFCLPCIMQWSKNRNTCPIDRHVFRGICVKDKGKTVRRIPVHREGSPTAIRIVRFFNSQHTYY